MLLQLLSVIVAPALLWALYHYRKDRHRPEPIAVLGLAYLGGVAAGFVCLPVSVWVGSLGLDPEAGGWHSLLATLVLGGILEELAKFLPFWIFCMRQRHFDEPIDGIVYASIVALGFASFENAQYMTFLDGAPLFARAIASPLTHCMFSSIWGWACGRARSEGRPLLGPFVVSFAIVAAAHGLYDYVVLGLPAYARPLGAGLILAIWIWRMRLVRGLQLRAETPGRSDRGE